MRNADYEFIVNPIVDVGFGKYGEAHFAPAARVARKLKDDLYVGLEYYADLGKIGAFSPLAELQHTLFAVTDFKLSDFNVNFGIGYGPHACVRPARLQDHHRLRISGARNAECQYPNQLRPGQSNDAPSAPRQAVLTPAQSVNVVGEVHF